MTTAPTPRGAGIIVIFFVRLIPGNSNIQFGNMSSNTANARGRQGQSNAANSSASWSDERRSGELLDAYIGAPMRLSQDSTIHPGWNPRIDCLSKLEWGQLIIIERETARFLNQNPTYMVTWSFSALSCCLLCLHLQFNLLISGIIRKQGHLSAGCKTKNRRLVQSSCRPTPFRPAKRPCKSAVHIKC